MMLNITATELPRFLTCPGSRMLEAIPKQEGDNSQADEGNAADWFVGEVFHGRFAVEELIDRKTPNGIYITEEMVDYLSEYLSWIVGRGDIEVDCSYQGQNWRVGGRADHVVYDGATGTLTISDLKYGWRLIEPDENKTLISHAVGWCIKNQMIPAHVNLRIYQPRPFHPRGAMREWSFYGGDLDGYQKEIFNKLDHPSNLLQTSSHCYKCPRLAHCPAAQSAGMNSLEVSEEAFQSEMSVEEIEKMIEITSRAINILKQNLEAYEENVIHRIKNGEMFNSYKLLPAAGRERWKEFVTPEMVEMLSGKDIGKKVLPTPKQALKAGLDEDFVKSLSETPDNGFKLTRCNANEFGEKMFNRKVGV